MTTGPKPEIPRFVAKRYGGARGFRASKRSELVALSRALQTFTLGCAYLPTGSGPVGDLRRIVSDLQRALSVKEWGR